MNLRISRLSCVPAGCRAAEALEAHTLKLWSKPGIRQAFLHNAESGESNQERTYFLGVGSLWRTARKNGRRFIPTRTGNRRAPKTAADASCRQQSSSLLVADRFASVKGFQFEVWVRVRMPHGLDHIVHAIRDSTRLAISKSRAGFHCRPRAIRHPWGTHNRMVQFAASSSNWSTRELKLIVSSALGCFSRSAGFRATFSVDDEGLAMLVLEGRAAAADAKAFRAPAIGDSAWFDSRLRSVRPTPGRHCEGSLCRSRSRPDAKTPDIG